MSAAMAREAREAAKRKVGRLTAEGSTGNAGPGDDPSKRIDASGWAEPVMNADAKTGMRPVSRRQFKSGGAVSGEHTKHRSDRKARKNGGGVDAKINRDVREANAELGKPHVGGFAEGGATNFRKQMHGMMGVGENLHGRRNGVGKFHRSHKADGGRAGRDDGGGVLDVLTPVLAGAGALGAKKALGLNKGGRTHKAAGGSLSSGDIDGMRPKGDRIPRKHGGKAKKGKTNIIIGIHAGGAHEAPPMPPQGAMPHPAAPPPPPQMPPQGGPPMGAGAPPGMMPPGMPPMPRKSGGKVVGAKYPDASIAKAERVKSDKGIPGGGAGGLGRLAKRSIAQKDGFRAV